MTSSCAQLVIITALLPCYKVNTNKYQSLLAATNADVGRKGITRLIDIVD